jgi:DUF971 family protein
MAAMTADAPVPTGVVVHSDSRVLELRYPDGRSYRLPFEFLRVHSPSAEVQGHGPGQETLQTGKRDVGIVAVEPVGYYAIRPTFSDGHESGIYSWKYLYELASDHERMWQNYLDRLAAAGLGRDRPMATAGGAHGASGGCGGDNGGCGCH